MSLEKSQNQRFSSSWSEVDPGPWKTEQLCFFVHLQLFFGPNFCSRSTQVWFLDGNSHGVLGWKNNLGNFVSDRLRRWNLCVNLLFRWSIRPAPGWFLVTFLLYEHVKPFSMRKTTSPWGGIRAQSSGIRAQSSGIRARSSDARPSELLL